MCTHLGKQAGKRNGQQMHHCNLLQVKCTVEPNVRGMKSCTGCEFVDDVTLSFDALDLPPRQSDRVIVTLAIGERFQELLRISGPGFQEYAAKCGADYRPILLDSSDFPEGDKFRIAQLFDHGYEDLLFIDADAVIMPGAENLFDIVPDHAQVAIHEDAPFLRHWDWLAKEYIKLGQSQEWYMGTIPTCYNTGVMLIRESARSALELPLRPFPRSHTAEQSLINLNIERHRLRVWRLGREWNEQWWFTGNAGGKNGSLPVRPGTRVYHWANAPHAVRLREMPARLNGSTESHGTPAIDSWLKKMSGDAARLTRTQQAVSLVETMARSAMTGLASLPVIQQRLAICQGCPKHSGGDCTSCGCQVTSGRRWRNKLAHRSATCPDGKW